MNLPAQRSWKNAEVKKRQKNMGHPIFVKYPFIKFQDCSSNGPQVMTNIMVSFSYKDGGQEVCKESLQNYLSFTVLFDASSTIRIPNNQLP